MLIGIELPKMPTCCEHCFALSKYDNKDWGRVEFICAINSEDLGSCWDYDEDKFHYDRPKWCPLKIITKEIKMKFRLTKRLAQVITENPRKHYKKSRFRRMNARFLKREYEDGEQQ